MIGHGAIGSAFSLPPAGAANTKKVLDLVNPHR